MSSYYFVGQSISTQGGTFVSPTFVGPVTFTGQMLAADGTVALPSYSFTNSPSTGIYSPAANQLGITQNGVQALLFSGSQLATFPAGTVAISTTSARINLGTGTADSAGSIRFGDASANGVLLLKYGAGANLRILSGTAAAYGGLAISSLFCTAVTGQDNATNFTVSQMQNTVINKTQAVSPYTVTNVNSSAIFETSGASGSVTFTLPAASTVGLTYTFTNATANGIVIDAAGTDVIRFPGSSSTAGGTQSSTTVGACVTITCTSSGIWQSLSSPGGTWTAA